LAGNLTGQHEARSKVALVQEGSIRNVQPRAVRPPFLRLKVALLALVGVMLLTIGSSAVSAAGHASFNSASTAVQNAFVAVQTAGKDGGNVTSLVARLNGALALVQRATTENSSNPSKASTDLQSAIGIAQGVQSSAATVAQQGLSARQLQLELSITSAVVVVGIAVALYFYGDRIYRRLWLRMYSGYVVKKTG